MLAPTSLRAACVTSGMIANGECEVHLMMLVFRRWWSVKRILSCEYLGEKQHEDQLRVYIVLKEGRHTPQPARRTRGSCYGRKASPVNTAIVLLKSRLIEPLLAWPSKYVLEECMRGKLNKLSTRISDSSFARCS